MLRHFPAWFRAGETAHSLALPFSASIAHSSFHQGLYRALFANRDVTHGTDVGRELITKSVLWDLLLTYEVSSLFKLLSFAQCAEFSDGKLAVWDLSFCSSSKPLHKIFLKIQSGSWISLYCPEHTGPLLGIPTSSFLVELGMTVLKKPKWQGHTFSTGRVPD